VQALAATADLLCSDIKSVEDRMRQAVHEAKETGTCRPWWSRSGTRRCWKPSSSRTRPVGDLIGVLKHLRAAQTNAHRSSQLRQVDPQATYSLRIFTLAENAWSGWRGSLAL